ncbi:NAD-P-binding protein [Amylostereum chailletii]|nr:NAD-P-binding protein [Amylostereum chailletii]
MVRVALVTGAAQGIGRGIALRLASDGLDVAVNDLPSKQAALASLVSEIEAMGRQSRILPGDVADEGQVESMVAVTVKELGGLDVMVANAGICPYNESILNVDVDHYEHIFAVNVRGVLLCYKHAAKQMIAQGRGGRIIGVQAWANLLAYSASKFAIRGLTQSAAVELAKHGITVNAYAPGAVDTPLLRPEGKEGLDLDQLATVIPVGRVAEPADIAHVVSFLASEKASFMTGQTVSSNGGYLLT